MVTPRPDGEVDLHVEAGAEFAQADHGIVELMVVDHGLDRFDHWHHRRVGRCLHHLADSQTHHSIGRRQEKHACDEHHHRVDIARHAVPAGACEQPKNREPHDHAEPAERHCRKCRGPKQQERHNNSDDGVDPVEEDHLRAADDPPHDTDGTEDTGHGDRDEQTFRMWEGSGAAMIGCPQQSWTSVTMTTR